MFHFRSGVSMKILCVPRARERERALLRDSRSVGAGDSGAGRFGFGVQSGRQNFRVERDREYRRGGVVCLWAGVSGERA